VHCASGAGQPELRELDRAQQVAQDQKAVYRAATAEEAERHLSEFAVRWDAKYPTIAALWQRHWERVIPFFAFPAEIRKVIYTTNAVELLNMSLRKAIKTRGQDLFCAPFSRRLRNQVVRECSRGLFSNW
jgi:transposase-like protein